VIEAILRVSETVLLVEDDVALQELVSTLLTSECYKVLKAKDAAAALILASEFHQKIDLVLTYVVMPKMSGVEMASRLRSSRPELNVLYMSGYSGRLLAH